MTYAIRRSDRASRSRIDVDLRGVHVVVPTGSRVDPERLLAEHAEWVVEKQAECAAERARVPERRFEPGATFPYRGEPHEVVIEKRSRSAVEGEALRLARHHVVETSIRRALECLYRRRARTVFAQVAEAFAPLMGVTFDRIEVRNQRTRWGSCSSNGTLSLNWRLVLGPPEVLEYVVVHELAHLKEANHSEAFWSIVDEWVPEYEERRAWLRENRVELVFSEEDL